MTLDDVQASIEAKGLSFQAIGQQQSFIKDALARGSTPQFKILDTCRLDNGGLLTLSNFVTKATATPARGFAAFIPAAGAASRYSAPLTPLIVALEQNDLVALNTVIYDLRASGAQQWPLPPRTQALILSATQISELSEDLRATLLRELSRPKALMPCVLEGYSFLQLKLLEHQSLAGLEGQVFVTPPGYAKEFAKEGQQINGQLKTPALPTGYIEQGPKLSTIRFDRNGCPIRETDGGVSLVPAGHGALASLLAEVQSTAPAADAVFIRNIDNVNGTGKVVTDVTAKFLTVHRKCLEIFRSIRAALALGELALAAEHASSLLISTPSSRSDSSALDDRLQQLRSPAERHLWQLLFTVIHTPPPPDLTQEALLRFYSRPVNLLGQVPNTNNDIGGTPCFVTTDYGPVKVCLEVPHASEGDKRNFLADPVHATHFNPVFVAAEIPTDENYYSQANRDFWLLSEKSYRGAPVVYYETVLYELLGNSFLANVIFVEVPREVFHPHKVLADAAGRSIMDWTNT